MNENKNPEGLSDKKFNIMTTVAGIPALICGMLVAIICIPVYIKLGSPGVLLEQAEKDAPIWEVPFLGLGWFFGMIIFGMLPFLAGMGVFWGIILVWSITESFIDWVKKK